jgi:hypothetical protein
MLNNETDTISEQNRFIEQSIKKHEELARLSAKDKETLKK